MGATGIASLNFGAFPGASDASVDVVSAGVVAGSLIEAWLRPAATADHSADEHMVETLKVFGVYLSDGNLRIHGFNTNILNEPVQPPRLARFSGVGQDAGGGQQDRQARDEGGRGTRIWGSWTISWAWN